MGGENIWTAVASKSPAGSSPRGRGKRVDKQTGDVCPGLIPAWAGKTFSGSPSHAHSKAHPRVGGENGPERFDLRGRVGSSPRGRGKPGCEGLEKNHIRLIPAWAGKTTSASTPRGCTRAHPRVGGENIKAAKRAQPTTGSSPRGRGKQTFRDSGKEAFGLIPAWAGKTRVPAGRMVSARAHPRVGGENLIAGCLVAPGQGSSPRGRGKRRCDVRHGLGNRLIPAWAGKTRQMPSRSCANRAHPRVGGENFKARSGAGGKGGSSPRGRGKHYRGCCRCVVAGLIPAWAGKTPPISTPTPESQAHPRVGGENLTPAGRLVIDGGSSPRGRGKPFIRKADASAFRLIPAWAGKTYPRSGPSAPHSAHPRVGGENGHPERRVLWKVGSSPRGRGKHFLTCAFIERIGQILETLELAVSSESYTLSAAYATDAPQDQARNTALVLPSSRGAS